MCRGLCSSSTVHCVKFLKVPEGDIAKANDVCHQLQQSKTCAQVGCRINGEAQNQNLRQNFDRYFLRISLIVARVIIMWFTFDNGL